MKIETHKIPVISTAHITQEVAARLDKDDCPWVALAVYQDCGYFLYLDEPSDLDEPVPKCLMDIRDWRRKLEREGVLDNSCWVRLDCDAEKVNGLTSYPW